MDPVSAPACDLGLVGGGQLPPSVFPAVRVRACDGDAGAGEDRAPARRARDVGEEVPVVEVLCSAMICDQCAMQMSTTDVWSASFAQGRPPDWMRVHVAMLPLNQRKSDPLYSGIVSL